MKKNKCEKQGFEHAWDDITPNIVYATNPPQYPPRQEKCLNCGLVRTFHSKTIESVEYSDGQERDYTYNDGSITICDIIGDGTTTATGTTNIL